MQPITALIIDDEPLAREALQLLVADRSDTSIVATCKDGREATEAIKRLKPDLVFLDIQMPELDGFGVIKEVGAANMPHVIFVTAYDQYAVKAFETEAVDYLLKPIEDDRFNKALDRAIRRIREERVGELGEQLARLIGRHDQEQGTPSQQDGYDTRIMIREKDAVRFVPVESIVWIEAAGDYVMLHTQAKRHLLRESMAGMEKRLDPNEFVRIHRSSIVNMNRISEMRPYFHGDYVVYLDSGKELKLSRRYRKAAEARLAGRVESTVR